VEGLLKSYAEFTDRQRPNDLDDLPPGWEEDFQETVKSYFETMDKERTDNIPPD
jgi:hypothetical protein